MGRTEIVGPVLPSGVTTSAHEEAGVFPFCSPLPVVRTSREASDQPGRTAGPLEQVQRDRVAAPANDLKRQSLVERNRIDGAVERPIVPVPHGQDTASALGVPSALGVLGHGCPDDEGAAGVHDPVGDGLSGWSRMLLHAVGVRQRFMKLGNIRHGNRRPIGRQANGSRRAGDEADQGGEQENQHGQGPQKCGASAAQFPIPVFALGCLERRKLWQAAGSLGRSACQLGELSMVLLLLCLPAVRHGQPEPRHERRGTVEFRLLLP